MFLMDFWTLAKFLFLFFLEISGTDEVTYKVINILVMSDLAPCGTPTLIEESRSLRLSLTFRKSKRNLEMDANSMQIVFRVKCTLFTK